MFIAHLPAGYLCAKLSASVPVEKSKQPLIFWGILLGSILPDLDILYFYLIDNRQTNHHLYWTHIPFFWVSGYLIFLSISLCLRRQRLFVFLSAVFTGGIVHLILDTPVGGTAWLFPFSKELLYLIEIPATQPWWVMNFLLHWTFLIELVICAAALVILFLSYKKRFREV